MNQLLERGIVASKNLLRYAIDLANPDKDFLSYDELQPVAEPLPYPNRSGFYETISGK